MIYNGPGCLAYLYKQSSYLVAVVITSPFQAFI